MIRIYVPNVIDIAAPSYEHAVDLLDRVARLTPETYDLPEDWPAPIGEVAATLTRVAKPKAAKAKPAKERKSGSDCSPEEKELAKRFKAKTGKRFYFDANSGKTRLEALKEALGE